MSRAKSFLVAAITSCAFVAPSAAIARAGAWNVQISEGGSEITYSATMVASSSSSLDFNVQTSSSGSRFGQQVTIGRLVLCRVANFKLSPGANKAKCRLRQSALKRINWKSDGTAKATLKMTFTNASSQVVSLSTPVTLRSPS
jgi:hypothetical protein